MTEEKTPQTEPSPAEQPTKETKPQETKKSKEQELQEKVGGLTDTLQRLQAEFDNFKKITDKQNAEYVKFALSSFVEELLPVLDSFDQAAKQTTDPKGLELVHKQLLSVLKSHGITEMNCVGKQLDPQLHDVMLKEQSEKQEDTIIEELQKGYMMHDKVLRHAKVKVSTN